MMLRLTSSAIALALALTASAQWGVRFSFMDFSHMTSTAAIKWQAGIGVDLETGTRTGIGIDFQFDPGILPGNALGSSSFLNGSVKSEILNDATGYYDHTISTYGVQFRSLYFFADNDEAAAYMGSFIGVRSITVDLDYSSQDSYYGFNIPYPNNLSASKVVVPIGLRIGVRGDLRQFYSDLHFCFGYQIGGGGELFDPAYKFRVENNFGEKDLGIAGLTYGFGWAFGFGSDGKRGKGEK